MPVTPGNDGAQGKLTDAPPKLRPVTVTDALDEAATLVLNADETDGAAARSIFFQNIWEDFGAPYSKIMLWLQREACFKRARIGAPRKLQTFADCPSRAARRTLSGSPARAVSESLELPGSPKASDGNPGSGS